MRIPLNRLTVVLPPLFLLIVFWWTSFYGINFGAHWDETRAKFDSISGTLRTGLFLQSAGETDGSSYNHGGVNYLLTWAGFAPEILTYMWKGPITREALSKVITPILYTRAIRIRVRAIYIVLSGLSILWLFCLNIVLGRSRLEALLGAAILGSSWEVAYHSRWIAPDVIMMQFGLFSFLCLALGSTRKSIRWFYLGAIAVGLATGTKYTGGIILPFFLVGAGHALWKQTRSVSSVLKHSIAFAGVAVLAFIMTNPGAILEPFAFLGELKEQQAIYGEGWFGFTVKPGIDHFLAILKYFSLQVFSHYWSVSIVFTAFCLLGFIFLLLESRLFAFLITSFALAYLAFFSQQAALIVRNLLVVVPWLALAAARGITVVAQRSSPWMARAVCALTAIFLIVNLGWEIHAAREVKKRSDSGYFLRNFERHVLKSPEHTFLVSAKLFNALHTVPAPLPGNIVTDPNQAYTKVAFFQSEGADRYPREWPSNWWGMYERTFGALEVNLEAYSTFIGNERILLVTPDHFRKLPINEKDMLAPIP